MEHGTNIRFGNFTILSLFLLLYGCIVIQKNEINCKKSLNDNQLKLDGYYYYFSEPDSRPSYKSTHGFILYNNGLVFNRTNVWSNGFVGLEKEFIKPSKNDKFKILDWGCYSFDNNKIQIKTFLYKGGNHFNNKWEVVNLSGVIKNDSTILINLLSSDYDNEKSVLNEEYHFKKFSPKPDSTFATKELRK